MVMLRVVHGPHCALVELLRDKAEGKNATSRGLNAWVRLPVATDEVGPELLARELLRLHIRGTMRPHVRVMYMAPPCASRQRHQAVRCKVLCGNCSGNKASPGHIETHWPCAWGRLLPDEAAARLALIHGGHGAWGHWRANGKGGDDGGRFLDTFWLHCGTGALLRACHDSCAHVQHGPFRQGGGVASRRHDHAADSRLPCA